MDTQNQESQDIKDSRKKYDHFIFSKTHLRKLTPELEKQARDELKEYPEHRVKNLEEFRQMVKNENLDIDTSDAYLIRFIRNAKYDKSRALRIVKNLLKTKKNNPDVFDGTVFPSKVKHVIESNLLTLLPNRDAKGRPIIVFRLRQFNTDKIPIQELYRTLYVMGEKLMQDESVQIRGAVGILDLEGLELKHVQIFLPFEAFRIINAIQDGFPVRVKEIHLVRENKLVDIGWPIVKTFLKPKHKKRFFFHSYDMSSLHKYIPPEHLPSEFGGTQGPMDSTEWSQILLDCEEEYTTMN